MAQAHSVTQQEIDRIVTQATVTELPVQAEAQTLAAPDFCAIYKSRVRPIIIIVIGFLKVINKGWAEAVASVVAIVDKICP